MPQWLKNTTSVPKATISADRLARALARRRKAELIEAIVEIASADRKIMRQLTIQFSVEVPPKELVAETRQAIVDATEFDEREINYNFDYDYQAYTTVECNFDHLIKLGHLREAMQLSLELMKQGSYQVEMSDEGMMTDDIEACLKVVISALTKSNLPDDDVIAWCAAMAKTDRVGFICDRELQTLRKRLKSS